MLLTLARAFTPLLLAALAPLVVAAAGFTQRSLYGTAAEDVFYGLFIRAYPLFLFVILYGVAHIASAALSKSGRFRILRVAAAPTALTLFLLACLYPTFGGVVVRAGYMTGGMSFLRGASGEVATLLGAGAAALVFGMALGACRALATIRIELRWRALANTALAFLALWLGAAILLGASRYGFDPLGDWPVLPLAFPAALKTAALVALALAPHACVDLLLPRRRIAPDSQTLAFGK